MHQTLKVTRPSQALTFQEEGRLESLCLTSRCEARTLMAPWWSDCGLRRFSAVVGPRTREGGEAGM